VLFRSLDEVQRRFGLESGLELHCIDLARDGTHLDPVALVHAGLFFEHAGVGRALDNAIALVAPGGHLSVVLQLPEASQPGVTQTAYPSMQTLAGSFAFVDVAEFRDHLEPRRFRLRYEELQPLSTGKRLWLGVFAGPE